MEYNASEDPATSRQRMQDGTFTMRNNIWWGFGNGNTVAAICNNDDSTKKYLFDNGYNAIFDPGIQCVDRGQNSTLNPRATASALSSNGFTWMDPLDPVTGYHPENIHTNGFDGCGLDTISVDRAPYEVVNFAGAFDPTVPMSASWAAGWTFLSCGGFFGDLNCSGTSCCAGSRGNVDNDPGDAVDIGDLVYMVEYSFAGGPAPVCEEEADVNGDSALDIGDLVYLVEYSFSSGPAPVACP